MDEQRETLVNLLEGLANADRVQALNNFISMQQNLLTQERTTFQQQITTERNLRLVAEKQRDAEKARGDQFNKLLTELARRPGFGCKMKKVFTLGIAKC